jgi:transcriptional regulator with XRE-family HTH domain
MPVLLMVVSDLGVSMSGRMIEPPRLPGDFWSRQDVHDSLTQRDFSVLFRLVAKYAGASQTQIAIVAGLKQSQVSTFMGGDRKVTSIEVAERVLQGLGAPDRAFIAFGLAPRGVVTWPEETRVPRPRRGDTGGGLLPGLATEDDVQRRDVLRFGGAALGAAAVPGPAVGQRLVELSRALTSFTPWMVAGRASSGIPALSDLATGVAFAKRNYQACRYMVVLDALPGLLASVRLACDAVAGDELLRVQALAADAYQVTGSVMLKIGDVGLAAFAADRSVEAATRSQDPVVLAASVRLVTHSLMLGGHAQRAKEIASQAAERLAVDVSKPDGDALSVYGALVLRGAAAAAISADRDDAKRLLDEADDAARRLGRDDNLHWTAFGPVNVAQHRVNVAKVLGDAGTAVDLARRIDVSRIPIAERKAALFIDTAEAFAQWNKYEQAYRALRMADEVAPEEVRTRGAVHRLLEDMAGRAPRGVRAKVYDFAEQIGVQV